MSFSVHQLQQMFEDKDKSEPHTPMFNGKTGSKLKSNKLKINYQLLITQKLEDGFEIKNKSQFQFQT